MTLVEFNRWIMAGVAICIGWNAYEGVATAVVRIAMHIGG